jgi:pyruvate dehydrogenase E2 component (dihydrolipoamide acetyltransferase)
MMPFKILMPALSPTMEKGNLAKWLVKEGDVVKAGQVIAEIETDKATMEYETADEGIMGKIVVAAGTDDVAVGTLIGTILEEGESAEAVVPAAPIPAPTKPAPAEPVGARVDSAPAGQSPILRQAQDERSQPDAGTRLLASPLARRIAEQSGVDLKTIKGSGPDGRIVKADLDGKAAGAAVPILRQAQDERAKTATRVEPGEGRAAPQQPPPEIPHEVIKLSGMRKVIARRLTESKQQVPHIYLTVDCLLDSLLEARKVLNARLEKSGVKLSVNDLIIKAVGLALRDVPDANVQFAADKMLKFSRVDISVAVSIPGGLITPIVRDAAGKGLAAISGEMAALAKKARDGKLQPEEYTGGTFSISNMGMMGIKDFCAVINPPQAGILAIGAGEQRAIVKNGAVVIATVMSVTGSFDHRVIDGAVGAEFLGAFKNYVEDPLMMLA